jgi:hypothetical protein
MPAPALALAAALLSFAVNGNQVEFTLNHGRAEITWLSPRTFRFRRSLEGPLTPARADAAAVKLTVRETPAGVLLNSGAIEVQVSRRGALLSVRKPDGAVIMSDFTEPIPQGDGVVWQREMPPGVRLYGLGARAGSSFDLRGHAMSADVPFLFTSAGYGEYHTGAGAYRFDLTGSTTYEISAPQMDYFFYYGPAPKAIFEERHKSAAPADEAAREYSRPLLEDSTSLWQALGEDVERLTHAALSGILAETFPASRYARVSGELRNRVLQVASLAPGSTLTPGEFRSRLSTFFLSYGPEKNGKGYPVWHPLPFQFPDDPECALHADEFMLGDEMLVAPIYRPGGKRQVYLPPGVWTNLETNESIAGRRTVTVETAGLPVFARNGTIVPFDVNGGLDLHYFPKLGAEFYLLEPEIAAWSVAHAAPAGDIFRLEIESKVARRYQWVVHQVERPASVGFVGQTSTAARIPERETERQAGGLSHLEPGRSWYYDASRKELQLAADVRAGEDCVIHVEFE